MIKFTAIINESKKQEYNGKVSLKDLKEYIEKTEKILPDIVRDALYLVEKYEILTADDINKILNSSKSSLGSLSKKFKMTQEDMEDLWKIFKDLKSNIKLFPHFLTQYEQNCLIKGTARIEDLTIDLTTQQGQNEVVKMYMPMVNKIINQFVGRSRLSREDLMSAADEAFSNAITDWDRSKGQLFKTYLSYRVQQQIKNDINSHGHSFSGVNSYAVSKSETGGSEFDAESLDALLVGDEEFMQDHLAALGYNDESRNEEVIMAMWEKVFELLEKKFNQRELDVFYRFFGVNGYKKMKSKDIAKMYNMSEGNVRNSILNKMILFLKNNSSTFNILSDIRDIYNESLMVELFGCSKEIMIERLVNDDIYILLEDITRWQNKEVFKRSLANSITVNKSLILSILKGGFDDIDNNLKKHKTDIVKFLSNMYPADNIAKKTDVALIEYMMELQEIYKRFNK